MVETEEKKAAASALAEPEVVLEAEPAGAHRRSEGAGAVFAVVQAEETSAVSSSLVVM